MINCLMPTEHFLAISWREQGTFDEMKMMSDSKYTNTLSWIFIVLAYWNNNSRVVISLHSGAYILFKSQPVLAPSTLTKIWSLKNVNPILDRNYLYIFVSLYSSTCHANVKRTVSVV
jgi:hypothetical protein